MSRREFLLIEGTSRKFWTIELDGSTHSVHFGRIGTAGQASRKEFATEAEARASHDKLVAEKLKKGYTEQVGEPASQAAPGQAVATLSSEPEVPPSTLPEAPESTSSSSLAASRGIDLAPGDWLWATWRKRTPKPRPEPAAFDLEGCLARLTRATSRSYGWEWDWSKSRLAPAMTRQEAHF